MTGTLLLSLFLEKSMPFCPTFSTIVVYDWLFIFEKLRTTRQVVSLIGHVPLMKEICCWIFKKIEIVILSPTLWNLYDVIWYHQDNWTGILQVSEGPDQFFHHPYHILRKIHVGSFTSWCFSQGMASEVPSLAWSGAGGTTSRKTIAKEWVDSFPFSGLTSVLKLSVSTWTILLQHYRFHELWGLSAPVCRIIKIDFFAFFDNLLGYLFQAVFHFITVIIFHKF